MYKKVLKRLLAAVLSVALLSSVLLSSTVAFAEEETETEGITETKELYSIIDGSFFSSTVYIPRGDNHDAQHLGIYLLAGESMTLKLTGDALPSANLTVRLLTDDSAKEEFITLPCDGTEITVTANYDCVPMIKTPVDNNLGRYTVEFTVAAKHELPVYTEGDGNDETFYSAWETSNAPYGIIESDRVIFLVPYCDRRAVQTNGKFASIAAMLAYFDAMLEQYDRFAGLEDAETADPWNVNTKSRYLIKADAHGAGAAYYSSNHVAMNDSSMGGFFQPAWINTHELGHGYGVVFSGTDSTGIDVGEVWNNIYGYYYETLQEPGETWVSSYWLPREAENLADYEKSRANSGYYDCGDYHAMLFFWLNIFDIDDPETLMAELNRAYRSDVYNKVEREYSGADLYAKYLTELSGYNLLPYFESWGFDIDETLKESLITSSKYENVISLRLLTETDEEAQALAEKLDIRDVYSLVSTSQLKEAGCTAEGKATINIEIDNIEELMGQTVVVTDGKTTVEQYTIDGTSKQLTLPIGIYTVEFPASNSGTYSADNQQCFFTVTTNASSDVTAKYTERSGNFLAGYTIQFLGLSNWEYMTAVYDPDTMQVQIDKASGAPHSYFEDSQYSSITVTTTDGNVIFTSTQTGNDSASFNKTLDVDIGYIITVSHSEAGSRLSVYPTQLCNANYYEFGSFPSSTDISFRITQYGLEPVENVAYNNAADSSAEDSYYHKLIAYMEYLQNSNDSSAWEDDGLLIKAKANIVTAVESVLDENQAYKFLSTYKEEYEAITGSTLELTEPDGYVDPDDTTDPTLIDPSSFTVTSDNENPSNSTNTEGPASYAFDSNADTIWHSNYTPSKQALPATITIDMNGEYTINKLTYLPRQDGSANGYVTAYTISVSSDGETWTDVADGTWASDILEKTATFSPVSAKYVKFTATAGTNDFASAAEISIYKYIDPYEDDDYTLGDVNFDGAINAVDATALLQHYARIITLSDKALKAADVDFSGTVTSTDATLILQYYAKLITSF